MGLGGFPTELQFQVQLHGRLRNPLHEMEMFFYSFSRWLASANPAASALGVFASFRRVLQNSVATIS